MPTPRVDPKTGSPTHDIVFVHEGDKRGFMLYTENENQQAVRALREQNVAPATRSFTVEQRSWLSGRGRVSQSLEPAGFFDSQDLWSMTDQALFPSLQWRWMKGIRNADFFTPEDNGVVFNTALGLPALSDHNSSLPVPGVPILLIRIASFTAV